MYHSFSLTEECHMFEGVFKGGIFQNKNPCEVSLSRIDMCLVSHFLLFGLNSFYLLVGSFFLPSPPATVLSN